MNISTHPSIESCVLTSFAGIIKAKTHVSCLQIVGSRIVALNIMAPANAMTWTDKTLTEQSNAAIKGGEMPETPGQDFTKWGKPTLLFERRPSEWFNW